MRPHPPIFNSTPAKIIEPKVGASTWAIGNQEWSPKTGSFTAKLRINQSLAPNLRKKEDKQGIMENLRGEASNRMIISGKVKKLVKSNIIKALRVRSG